MATIRRHDHRLLIDSRFGDDINLRRNFAVVVALKFDRQDVVGYTGVKVLREQVGVVADNAEPTTSQALHRGLRRRRWLPSPMN